MTGAIGQHIGINPQKWLEAVVRELSLYTSRPIIVKTKGEGDLQETLQDAWCLVTHSSNAAMDSVIAGVPAITLGPSAVKPVSWSFKDIESPHWPERQEWLNALAYNQWTLDEMRKGVTWSMLNADST